jgi:fucose permease
VGAIVSQPFVSFSGRGDLSVPSTILIAASVIFAATLAIISFQQTPQNPQTAANIESGEQPRLWSNPRALLLVAFGFFDVGIESGVSGWLTAYTLRSDLPPEISWLSATPLFFFFFVGGRGLAAISARRFTNNQIIWASLLLTLAGTTLLLIATGWQLIFVGAAILGLGLAAVFPTNMARLTDVLGADAGSRAVPLFVMGSFGSITITWLIGYFSNLYNNDLSVGLAVLLGAAGVLLILQIILHFQMPRIKLKND